LFIALFALIILTIILLFSFKNKNAE
jgi:hypothetical protein